MNFFDKSKFKMKKKGIIPLKAWNALVDAVWALSVQNVSGSIQMRRGVDGTSLAVRRMPGSVANKLKLIIRQGTAADKFQVTPGTVNLLVPTLATVALDDVATPEFTVAATTHVWIKCVGTFGSPDTYVMTIETDTAGTGIGDPPSGTNISATGFVSFFYIGAVEFTDNSPDPNTLAITNFHTGGNLGVDSFGLYNVWWRS